MSAPERVVLVGFMGAGKSTIGARLAELLGWRFVDLDRQIEARASRSVAELFREAGEPGFRALEYQAALDLRELAHAVVAAGGGAFAEPATREVLQTRALTVWLRCDLETALGRISADGSRPLAENRERMARLMAEREASYRRADLTIDAAPGDVGDIARRVWDALLAPLELVRAAETT